MMMMILCLLNLHMYNAYVNDAGVAVAPPKWKCDFGPGLGNVLDICGTQKWGETVLEFPNFSGPFGEVGEVFVLTKSLRGDSRKVKALFKAGFGPGLDKVLEWRCIKIKNPGSDYFSFECTALWRVYIYCVWLYLGSREYRLLDQTLRE